MEFDDYKKNTTILDSSSIIENNEYDSKKISEAIENGIQSENYIYDYKKICENCCMHFRNDDVIEIFNICTPESSYPVINVNMDLKYVIPTHRNYTISNTFENNTYYITSKVPFINIDSEDVNKQLFIAKGNIITFDGYLKLYQNNEEDTENNLLPKVKENDNVFISDNL